MARSTIADQIKAQEQKLAELQARAEQNAGKEIAALKEKRETLVVRRSKIDTQISEIDAKISKLDEQVVINTDDEDDA